MEQIRKLFSNDVIVCLSAILATLYNFLFPEEIYATAAFSVLGVMTLDLLTKLYALSKQAGGLRKAWKKRSINSKEFSKGTMDKLIIFGVLLVICGLAYRLTLIGAVAVWFTQAVFTIMFLRDGLSILENLADAGLQGLGPFKRLLKHKMDEYDYMKEDADDEGETNK